MRKSIALIILTAFLANTCVPPSYSQAVLDLPVPGTVVNLSQAFSPVMIKGINVHPENAMMFDFIVDPGQSGLGKDTVGAEATKLIKYFMAALAVPEDDLWVNLSPYENDRIIPEALGQTEMGRDMLAQDYLLKQITASLIDPQSGLGKEFWARIYSEAYAKYGTTDIPVDTFNKVWIMPARAVVYENKGQAVVVESSLKVMLETDYLALENNTTPADTTNDEAKSVLRELVIPVLEKEVNTGRNFAPLRQVYNALVLAHWFRVNFNKSVLHKVYADRSRIKGVDVDDKEISKKIYSQYVDSFKKGVYNYVKEEYDPFTQELIPRKYFSGGETFNRAALDAAMTTTSDASQADKFSREMDSRGMLVTASFNGIPVTAPAVNEYRLSSGRPVVSRIPADTWKRFGNGKEGFQVIGERLFENFPWISTRASYRKVDMDFEVTARIIDLYHQGRGRSVRDPITVLSWGCGEGVELTGLWDVVSILKRKYRDINVRVIGYSRDFYPAWSEIPSEVDMIIDDQKDLVGDLSHLGVKKLDIVFSRLGFTHFLSSQKEDALKHLEALGALLGPDGEMRIDIHGDLTGRQYAEIGLKSAGMVRVTSTYGLRVERLVSKDNAEASGPDGSNSHLQDIVDGLIFAGFAGIGIRPMVDALAANADVSFRRVLSVGGVLTLLALVWLWEHKRMKAPVVVQNRMILYESIQQLLTGLPYSSAYTSIIKAGIAVQERLAERSPAGEAIVALADLVQQRDPGQPLVQWDSVLFSDLSAEEQQRIAALDSPFVFEADMITSRRLAELQWEAAEGGEEFQDLIEVIKKLRAEKIDGSPVRDKAEAFNVKPKDVVVDLKNKTLVVEGREAVLLGESMNLIFRDGNIVYRLMKRLPREDEEYRFEIAEEIEEGMRLAADKGYGPKVFGTGYTGNDKENGRFYIAVEFLSGQDLREDPSFPRDRFKAFITAMINDGIFIHDFSPEQFIYNKATGEFKLADSEKTRPIIARYGFVDSVFKSMFEYLRPQWRWDALGLPGLCDEVLAQMDELLKRTTDKAEAQARAERTVDLKDFDLADEEILSKAGQSTIYISKDGNWVLKDFDERLPVFGARTVRYFQVTEEHVSTLASLIRQVHGMLLSAGQQDIKLEVPELVRIKGGRLAFLSRKIVGNEPKIDELLTKGAVQEYMDLLLRVEDFRNRVDGFTGGLYDYRRDYANYLKERKTGELYNIDPVNMEGLVERMGLIKIRETLNMIRGSHQLLSLFKEPVRASLQDVKDLKQALDGGSVLSARVADALKSIYTLEFQDRIRDAAFQALHDASLQGDPEAARVVMELVPLAEQEMLDGKDMPMVYSILETATAASISDPRAFEVVGRRLDDIRRFLSSGMARRNLKMQGMIIKTLEQSVEAVPAAGKLLEEFQGDNAEAQVKGGIDFKAKNMHVDVTGEGIDFQLPEEMRGMDFDDIEGLTPVIMNIIPVQNMSTYLLASS